MFSPGFVGAPLGYLRLSWALLDFLDSPGLADTYCTYCTVHTAKVLAWCDISLYLFVRLQQSALLVNALWSMRFKYYQRRTHGSVRIIIMNIDVRADHTIWRHPGVEQPPRFCIWCMQSIMCDTFVDSMARIRRRQLMEAVLVVLLFLSKQLHPSSSRLRTRRCMRQPMFFVIAQGRVL